MRGGGKRTGTDIMEGREYKKYIYMYVSIHHFVQPAAS